MKLALWGSRINANIVCALVQILKVLPACLPVWKGDCTDTFQLYLFSFSKLYVHNKQKNLSGSSGGSINRGLWVPGLHQTKIISTHSEYF